MTEKEKIRAEVERLKGWNNNVRNSTRHMTLQEEDFNRGKHSSYLEILDFIDSLQDEPKFKVGDTLRRKSDGCHAKVIEVRNGNVRVESADWDMWILNKEWELVEEPKKCMYSKDDYTDEDKKVLCDGCEEECIENVNEERKRDLSLWSLGDFENNFFEIIKPYKNSHNYKNLCTRLAVWQSELWRWINWKKRKEEPVSNDFTKALAECIHQAQGNVVDPMVLAETWKDELIKLAKSEEPVSDEWIKELRTKLDSLSKEDFEKVWAKYNRYGSVDYNKLNTMLDDSLSKETKESWNKRLGEESVNEELEEEIVKRWKILHGSGNPTPFDTFNGIACHFATWQKAHLWKPADGDDLPETNREVITLLDNGKVVFAHRPPEYWDGKNIVTGKVTRHYPKTYDKGGWNIPNVKYWLDYDINELLCREK